MTISNLYQSSYTGQTLMQQTIKETAMPILTKYDLTWHEFLALSINMPVGMMQYRVMLAIQELVFASYLTSTQMLDAHLGIDAQVIATVKTMHITPRMLIDEYKEEKTKIF